MTFVVVVVVVVTPVAVFRRRRVEKRGAEAETETGLALERMSWPSTRDGENGGCRIFRDFNLLVWCFPSLVDEDRCNSTFEKKDGEG